MNKRKLNKALALAGSFALSNGVLLLLAPDRYPRMRKSSMLPDTYNRALDQAAANRARSRSIGTSAVILGLALLGLAAARTEPE